MWATGGYEPLLPVPNVVRHDWTDANLGRYAAGDIVSALHFATSELPAVIQMRLSSIELPFGDLDGLLQRALMWDSGYVVTSVNAKFVEVYTHPLNEMDLLSTVNACLDVNNVSSHRAHYCSAQEIYGISYCATTDVETSSTLLTMWADGGVATDIPEPHVIRHYWADGTGGGHIISGSLHPHCSFDT